MDIDEFLTKIENGENVDPEKPKSPIDSIVEQLNDQDNDKIAVSDKVIGELKSFAGKIKEEKASNESMISKIKQELLVIRNDVAGNNMVAAKSSLAAINEMYDMIPDDLADSKTELKKDISAIESVFFAKMVEFNKTDFARKNRIISVSIAQARSRIKEKRTDAAIAEYKRCQDIYHSLPEGFLLEKIGIYEQIVELYKEIIISMQISSLQNRLVI